MKQKTEWDLGLVLPEASKKNIAALRKEVQTETTDFVKEWKSRQDYLVDAGVLAQALVGYERYQRLFADNATGNYYFELLLVLNQTNPKTKAGLNLAEEFGKKKWLMRWSSLN